MDLRTIGISLPALSVAGRASLTQAVSLRKSARVLSARRCAGVSSVRRFPTLKVHASSKKTFSSFEDMISDSDIPVLVDFYATWCGPCQYMAPVLEDVGRALKHKIRVVKVDTEKYPSVASRYGVQALPTFVLFQNGKPIDRLEGALPADKFLDRIQDILAEQTVNVGD